MAVSRTESILDRAHDAVISMDERGLVRYWNPSAEPTFGISREDALAGAVVDLIARSSLRVSRLPR